MYYCKWDKLMQKWFPKSHTEQIETSRKELRNLDVYSAYYMEQATTYPRHGGFTYRGELSQSKKSVNL